MTARKNLKGVIRGWLPKESSHQSIVTTQVNQKTTHQNKVKVYMAVFVGVFAADLLVMGVVNRLGLGTNYATFAAATTGILATIIASVLLKKPNQNKPTTESEKRAAKILAIANAGMVCIFLGTYFWVNPSIASVEVTLGLWIILLFSWFLVNNLLYRKLKKQTGLMEGL